MTKQEYLSALGRGLSGLPHEEVEERLNFYGEMIDDRMEEGLTEGEAVAQIGAVDAIVSQIIGEIPLSKLVKEKVKPRRKLKAWEIVLIVLGAPLWLPLLIAAAAVVFSLYITVWALIVSLWAVFVSFAGGGVWAIVCGIAYLAAGNSPMGLAAISIGLVLLGLSVYLFFACKAATLVAARLTRRFVLWLKKQFMKKEEA